MRHLYLHPHHTFIPGVSSLSHISITISIPSHHLNTYLVATTTPFSIRRAHPHPHPHPYRSLGISSQPKTVVPATNG